MMRVEGRQDTRSAIGRRKRFSLAAAFLLAIVVLGAWFAFSYGSTQSAGTLTVSMTDAPDPVAPGGTVTYTITVENAGATEEPFVDFSDTLDGPGTIQNVLASQGSCAVVTAAAITCALGSLPPGGIATITVEKLTAGPVGGTATLLEDSESPREDASGSGRDYAAPIAAAVAGAAVALGAGGWYVRRRLSR